MTLLELANKYHTDKGSTTGDKNNYAELYETYFCGMRESAKFVLEIGIHCGASLRMWRDYFSSATIYGIDIKPETMFKEDRIVCKKRDQSVGEDLVEIASWQKWDIIIDDGSHVPKHQIETLIVLWPTLISGGIYVVEDICTSYLKRFTESHQFPVGAINDFLQLGRSITEMNKTKEDKVILSGNRFAAVERAKKTMKLVPMEESLKYIHLYKNIAILGKM